YPNGYDRAAKSAQIMTESGKLLDFGCEGNRAFVRPSALALDRVYKSIYKLDELTLGLTVDGYLRSIQGSASAPFSLGELDGNIHELAPSQTVEFFSEQ